MKNFPEQWQIEQQPNTDYAYFGTDVSRLYAKDGNVKTIIASEVFKPDAEFIVRACNAHDSAVSALMLAAPILDSMLNGSAFIEPEEIDAALMAVCAALAKARQ